MPVSAPDTQLLNTEAMQKLVTNFQNSVINYGAKLAQVMGRVDDLITDAWQGDKGPLAFKSLHGDWDKQIKSIVAIIDDIGRNVGIQSQKFQQIDNDAARANADLTAPGFGG